MIIMIMLRIMIMIMRKITMINQPDKDYDNDDAINSMIDGSKDINNNNYNSIDIMIYIFIINICIIFLIYTATISILDR